MCVCACLLHLENSNLAQLERKNRTKSPIIDAYASPVFVWVQVKALLSVCLNLCGWSYVHCLGGVCVCACVCTYWEYVLGLTTAWRHRPAPASLGQKSPGPSPQWLWLPVTEYWTQERKAEYRNEWSNDSNIFYRTARTVL